MINQHNTHKRAVLLVTDTTGILRANEFRRYEEEEVNQGKYMHNNKIHIPLSREHGAVWGARGQTRCNDGPGRCARNALMRHTM